MINKKSKLLLSFICVSACAYSYEKIKLGTSYGGWTIPSFLGRESVCYCVGAGEDISFDLALVESFGCSVYIMDPTPRSLQHFQYVKSMIRTGKPAYSQSGKSERYTITSSNIDKLQFLPIGLWTEDVKMRFFEPQNPSHVSHSIVNLQQTTNFFEADCKKLSTIMARLGHQYIDLLKMDIEGAEYTVIENILKEKISVKCLCAEFHSLPEESKNQSLEKIIALLQCHGFEIFHRHGKDITFFRRE